MMRIPAVAFFLVLFCPASLVALDSTDDVRVPVIVVDAGERVESTLTAAVIRQLASPVVQGADLLPRLSGLFSLNMELKRVLDRLFIRALDNFFAGRHGEAKADFIEIVGFSETQPAAILDHLLRKIVFKTHLYLAIIANSKKDERRVDEQILEAVIFSADFEPEPAEFPPWLCERFARAKRSHDSVPVERPYRPTAFQHSEIIFSRSGFVLAKDDSAPVDRMLKDLLVVAKSGGWTRLVAIVGTGVGVEIWLVDAEVNRIVRKTQMIKTDSKTVEKAIEDIVVDSPMPEWKKDHDDRRVWYKNGLAWSLAGVGAAMLTSGIVLSQVLSMPSPEEVWAWTLIAGGAGLMATGTVMFFFPVDHGRNREPGKKNETAFGIMISGKF
jgi:hypothetical protein